MPPRTAWSSTSRPARRAARGTRTGRSSSALHDGGGDVLTNAQITGTAASMGEGVVAGVLDGMIKDFTGKVGTL